MTRESNAARGADFAQPRAARRPHLARAIAVAALAAIVGCGDGSDEADGLLGAEPAPVPPCSQAPNHNGPSSPNQPGSVLVYRGSPSYGVLATGTCADTQLLMDIGDCVYPAPGCKPVPISPTWFQTYAFPAPPPNTKIRVFSETGFRGNRTDYTPVPWTEFDYNGQGYPPMRSLLVLVGTPSSNITTLVSTRTCNRCDLQGANLSGLDLHGVSLQDANLSHADLTNANLSGANASRAVFASATLIGTNLTGATLTQAYFHSDGAIPGGGGTQYPAANLSSANLTNARLDNAVLTGVVADSAVFAGAVVSHADFSHADLARADLESISASASLPAIFNGAIMTYASLKNAQLSGSFFRGAVMSPSNLGGADLSGAWMEADADGVFGRVTLANSFMLNTKLNGAHLTDAVLDGVSWYNVNAASPIASGADALLTGASFNLADLPGLDLSRAYLQGATFTNAQLIGANLTGAQMQRDGSVASNLSTANLAGTNLTSTNLSYANLQNAKVDPQPASEIYIEVLKDPDRFQKPVEYQFFAVNRPATVLGSGGTVSVVTSNATCPSGAAGACGAITSPSWVAQNPPKEPSDCMPTGYDSEGNVISITCSSSRHPTGG